MSSGFVAGDPHNFEIPVGGRRRAVFVDRDGTINAMWRHSTTGAIDSPMGPEEFELLPGAGEALRAFNQIGLAVIVVSNQPVIAKGKTTLDRVEATTSKLRRATSACGASIDDIYYCLHHPASIVPELRVECACRKPNAGLLRQAARKHDIDLTSSYMIGDMLTDVQAGRTASCRTVWLSDGPIAAAAATTLVTPHHHAPSLVEAARLIIDLEARHQKAHTAASRSAGFTRATR